MGICAKVCANFLQELCIPALIPTLFVTSDFQLFRVNNYLNKIPTRGGFQKSWAHGVSHRYSSLHLCSMPTPYFWEAILWRKVRPRDWKIGVGRKTVYKIDPKAQVQKCCNLRPASASASASCLRTWLMPIGKRTWKFLKFIGNCEFKLSYLNACYSIVSCK